MLTPSRRRDALLAIAGAGALLPSKGREAIFASNDREWSGPDLSLGLWSTFPEVVVPAGVRVFRSNGFAAPGLGAATYVVDIDQVERPISPSRRRSRNGRWFRLAEPIVTPQMFGARGDLNTDDAAAIQDAMDFVEPARGCVFFPAANYLLLRSLRLPNEVSLIGAGAGSVLNNQFNRLDAPQIVNKDPSALIYASISNLVLRGGSYGIKLDVEREVAGLVISDVVFDLQTFANMSVSKLLQTSRFTNVVFDRAPHGLLVSAPTSNCNTFVGCDFTNHSMAHVHMRSGEVNNFIGCRFEGGGMPKSVTIDVDSMKSMQFDGCYFEGTHKTLLRETGSNNGIVFSNSHFTGASTPRGLEPYEFLSDGVVTFGNNSWRLGAGKAGFVRITGDNSGALAAAKAEVWGESHASGGFRPRDMTLAAGTAAIPVAHLRAPEGGYPDGETLVVDLKIRVFIVAPDKEFGLTSFVSSVQVTYDRIAAFRISRQATLSDSANEAEPMRFRGRPDVPQGEFIVEGVLRRSIADNGGLVRVQVDFQQFASHAAMVTITPSILSDPDEPKAELP